MERLHHDDPPRVRELLQTGVSVDEYRGPERVAGVTALMAACIRGPVKVCQGNLAK